MIYKILSAKNKIWLEANVNELLADGWTPCGGMAVSNNEFYQAMLKVEYEYSLTFSEPAEVEWSGS